ncbi:nucleotidyltransferase family protein [Asticcacaulis sp. AND118]|uniref:nucleotidyltransferase family protein n=1 Tax=Asticcacaulis sp. AND118 TaxID=2840468 RepID=UPI001CFF6F39|nr:nucleotidyltransferase family protein [Asticcacaulis sp. AND118]UDF05098.1 nucleotidyltransferase family protein [Asticcacaulis sp. AND118]
MKPSDALSQYRGDIRSLTQRFRLENPRVFGSVLKGTDTEASDLDLLVDAPSGTTLFDLCGLQVDLEERLGVRVEVLTPQDLPARFRDKVVREAAAI